MNQKKIELFKRITEFSYVTEVSPPKTTNIWDWWDTALKEMDDFLLFALLEQGFTSNDGKTLQKMRKRLVEEVEKRQSLHILA